MVERKCHYISSLNDPLLKTKLFLGGKKKKLDSVIWTYLPYSFDSFIHSHWWQLKATQKRSVLATIKLKTFPVPPSFGVTPAVALKEFKRIFFQSRKEAKDSKPVNEWSTFLQRNQWKTIKGSLGPKGHSGMSSNLPRSFCFIFIYFLSALFVTIWGGGGALFWQPSF